MRNVARSDRRSARSGRDAVRFLILTHEDDDLAFRIYVALRNRHGSAAVALATDTELVHGCIWRHQLDSEGCASTLVFSDGRRVTADGLWAVLNRLREVRPAHFYVSAPEDLEYALMETHALWLSWLHSLRCPVLNRPTPQGLSGSGRSHVEWLCLAYRAGLPIRGYELSTEVRMASNPGYQALMMSQATIPHGVVQATSVQRVPGREPVLYLEPVRPETCLVEMVGNQILGTVPGLWNEQLLQLRRLGGCELLDVVFGQATSASGADPRWKLLGVSPFIQGSHRGVIKALVERMETGVDREEPA
jgi:hypothetical protein